MTPAQNRRRVLRVCVVALSIVIFAFCTTKIWRESKRNRANQELVSAAAAGDLILMKRALESGANINFQTSGTGFTPLHWAVYEEEYEAAKLLIKTGANATIRDAHGSTVSDLLKEKEAEDAEAASLFKLLSNSDTRK